MRKFALSLVAVFGLASFASAQDCGALLTATPVIVAQPAFASVAFSPFVSFNSFASVRVVNPFFVNRVTIVQPAVRVNVVGVRRANVRVRVR